MTQHKHGNKHWDAEFDSRNRSLLLGAQREALFCRCVERGLCLLVTVLICALALYMLETFVPNPARSDRRPTIQR